MKSKTCKRKKKAVLQSKCQNGLELELKKREKKNMKEN